MGETCRQRIAEHAKKMHENGLKAPCVGVGGVGGWVGGFLVLWVVCVVWVGGEMGEFGFLKVVWVL